MENSVKLVGTVAVCTTGAYLAYRACCRYEPACSAMGCTQHVVRLHRKGKVKQYGDLYEILQEASAIPELQAGSLQDNLESALREIEYEVDYTFVEALEKSTKAELTGNQLAADETDVELRRRSVLQLFTSAPLSVASTVLNKVAQIRSSVNGLFARRIDDRDDSTTVAPASIVPDPTSVSESEQIHKVKSHSTEAQKSPSHTGSSPLPSSATQADNQKRDTTSGVTPTLSEKTTERSSATLNSTSATQMTSNVASSSTSRADSKPIEKTAANKNENGGRLFGQVEANEHTLQTTNANFSLEMAANANGVASLESASTETVTMSSETSIRKITFEEYLLFLSMCPPSSECDHREEFLHTARDAVSKKKVQFN